MPGEAAIGVCPYRGLEAFDVADSRYFLGREALVEWLISDLRRMPGTDRQNRFLAIVGASGSGKSSLARAGLLAQLGQGAIEIGSLSRSAARPGTGLAQGTRGGPE